MYRQRETAASGLPPSFKLCLLRAKWELGVYFITDSFLMGEEAEMEPVTWHLLLSGCVEYEF